VALRRNHGMLLHFCKKLFCTIYTESDIIDAFNNAFDPTLTEHDAASKVWKLVNEGTASTKRMIKDLIHRISNFKFMGSENGVGEDQIK